MKIFLEITLLIIIIVVFIFLFFISVQTVFSPVLELKSLGSVCIRGNCFSVELAKTQAERNKGLMYRKKLDRDKGMLFIFEKEGIYPFWMENTLIPLDIIWIDGNNKIVFIGQNIQPCKSLICPSVIPSGPTGGYPARYVLEINAGISNQLGFKIGDPIEFKN